MSNEMLDRDILTRRREPWKATIAIKHLLTDEGDLSPEQINEKGKAIAGKLSKCKLFENDDVIERFEMVDDLDEFNDALAEMYDECDRARIWCK